MFTRLSSLVGAVALQVATDTGGMTLVLGRIVRRLWPVRLDTDELWRSLWFAGERSAPIVLATAAFTGSIMVLQAAVYVQKLNVYSLTGWFTGFTVFREIGPMLIGLMFSGRVGANNTSELATMRQSEQLDALLVLALDPYELLVLPRTLSMIIAMGALVILGDVVAVGAGALCARLLMGVEYHMFLQSILDRLGPTDVLLGVAKALLFGLIVAVVSTYYGLRPGRGAGDVGRAVNAQVVASAVALFWADYLVSWVVR